MQQTEVARETLTWEGFGRGSRELAALVADSGFRPDVILAIARGGLQTAGALAYALSVKNCYVMNVEFYTGEDQRLDFPLLLPPPLNLVDLHDTRVLVADDVADTGSTLAMVTKLCGEVVADIKTAVLYQKPHSIIDCDFVWRRTSLWIDFPWSSEPPLVR
jgi:hypoxanthine phosphoribosyltransferase